LKSATRFLIVGVGGHGRSVAEAAMLSGRYVFELTAVIHPKAIVSPSAFIELCCSIMAGAKAFVGWEMTLYEICRMIDGWR